MQRITSRQTPSCYRLIDSGCEPHCELDGHYSSLEEAIADAIAWLEPLVDLHSFAHVIGVDVATGDGNWRTCRPPGLLLCPLLCEMPGCCHSQKGDTAGKLHGSLPMRMQDLQPS